LRVLEYAAQRGREFGAAHAIDRGERQGPGVGQRRRYCREL
jgi:hypothetical protein